VGGREKVSKARKKKKLGGGRGENKVPKKKLIFEIRETKKTGKGAERK